MMEICDIHGHFLPDMDDGCKTVEESLEVLHRSAAQGVTCMIATPHYYPVETAERFLERRQRSWEMLRPHLDDTMPRVYLGAEVAYFPGIGNGDRLEELCLAGSDCLLLEMPFSRWTGIEMRDVRTLCAVRGIRPILAHLERYLGFQQKNTVWELLEQDVMAQVNAGSLLGSFSGNAGRKLIRKGMVQYLGSDCHNLTTRCPNLGEGMDALIKHGMRRDLEVLAENSMDLIR